MKTLSIETTTGFDHSGLFHAELAVNGLTELTVVQDFELSFHIMDSNGQWPISFDDIDSAMDAAEMHILKQHAA